MEAGGRDEPIKLIRQAMAGQITRKLKTLLFHRLHPAQALTGELAVFGSGAGETKRLPVLNLHPGVHDPLAAAAAHSRGEHP